MSRELRREVSGWISCVALLCVSGCASTDSHTQTGASSGAPGTGFASKYRATDGRTIEIGRASRSENGWSFKDPHLNKCWIADDFKFGGYDTLCIVPTLSTAKLHAADEEHPHEMAKERLMSELKNQIIGRELFATVITSQSDLKPGSLKLENTIVEYAKGGGGARYWAGMFGAGQPVLLVQGKMTDGDKTVFTYEARRSGVSAAARVGGGYLSDEDIQYDDIRSMSLDLADFIAAIQGKYQPNN